MEYNIKNKNYQFILLQNKAYHEEKLINLKSTIDNKLSDYSHIHDRKIPSRKNYLEREKLRGILLQNNNLYNKISTIVHDRSITDHDKSIVLPNINNSHYRSYSQNSMNKSRSNASNSIFDQSYCINSMNINNRLKEFDRINDDNKILLHKLCNIKPVINFNEYKQHEKLLKKISKRLRSYDKHNKPKSMLCIYDRNKLNPILNKFISRHEIINIKENSLDKQQVQQQQQNNHKDMYNSNVYVDLESIVENNNEDKLNETLRHSTKLSNNKYFIINEQQKQQQQQQQTDVDIDNHGDNNQKHNNSINNINEQFDNGSSNKTQIKNKNHKNPIIVNNNDEKKKVSNVQNSEIQIDQTTKKISIPSKKI